MLTTTTTHSYIVCYSCSHDR